MTFSSGGIDGYFFLLLSMWPVLMVLFLQPLALVGGSMDCDLSNIGQVLSWSLTPIITGVHRVPMLMTIRQIVLADSSINHQLPVARGN